MPPCATQILHIIIWKGKGRLIRSILLPPSVQEPEDQEEAGDADCYGNPRSVCGRKLRGRLQRFRRRRTAGMVSHIGCVDLSAYIIVCDGLQVGQRLVTVNIIFTRDDDTTFEVLQ